jgi:hypothetical protein
MNDTSWVRSVNGKGIQTTGAVQGDNHGSFGNVWAGSYNGAAVNSWGKGYVRYDNFYDGGDKTWGNAPLLVKSERSSSALCAIALHVNGYAPILEVQQAVGEQLHCLNNTSTGWIPIRASAFTVSSSERIKSDVRDSDPDALLEQLQTLPFKRWRPTIGPLTLRLNRERYRAALRHRMAAAPDSTGRRGVPSPEPSDYDSAEHECGTDCAAPPGQQCAIGANHHDHVGLTAEDLLTVMPEAVVFDEHLLPSGIDIAQVATTALALVGVLARRLADTQTRLEALEAR